jgi:uncharacterized protein (TIGR02145 family)
MKSIILLGALYNWHVVSEIQDIAPEGWHVPTDEEWKILELSIGMLHAQADSTLWRRTDEGGKLKEQDTLHWASPNFGATDLYGFKALPSGFRSALNGSFNGLNQRAYYWTSSSVFPEFAYPRGLQWFTSTIYREYSNKWSGFSIRCIKD